MPTTISVIGRLGKDADIKDVNGKRVMELTIADSDKTAGVETTIWRKATFWDDNYRKVEPYLKRGTLLQVTGQDKPARTYMQNGETKVDLSMTGHMIQLISVGKGRQEQQQSTSGLGEAKPKEEEPSLYPPC